MFRQILNNDGHDDDNLSINANSDIMSKFDTMVKFRSEMNSSKNQSSDSPSDKKSNHKSTQLKYIIKHNAM